MKERDIIWVTYRDITEDIEITMKSEELASFLLDYSCCDIDGLPVGEITLLIRHEREAGVVWRGCGGDAVKMASLIRDAMISAIRDAEAHGVKSVSLVPLQDRYTVLENVLEKAAALSHLQWAHWTRYMLDNLTPENISRWNRQINTDYCDLTDPEKESDRVWARKYLKEITGCSHE